MVNFERLRNFHDDIVFRHIPDLRDHAPLILSATFLIALTTMAATSFLGPASALSTPRIHAGTHANTDDPTLGPTLRLSRLADRTAPPSETARARAPDADANDPKSPMLIDIDPEGGAVHASAGTIDVFGTPINIGSWPLD